jgi:hypothetical protein
VNDDADIGLHIRMRAPADEWFVEDVLAAQLEARADDPVEPVFGPDAEIDEPFPFSLDVLRPAADAHVGVPAGNRRREVPHQAEGQVVETGMEIDPVVGPLQGEMVGEEVPEAPAVQQEVGLARVAAALEIRVADEIDADLRSDVRVALQHVSRGAVADVRRILGGRGTDGDRRDEEGREQEAVSPIHHRLS